MIINEQINVKDDRLVDGLTPVVKIMSQVETSEDSFYAMPNGLRWNGTIVALRIPYHSDTFNYINYIE
jgi:hypothetical protein